MKNRISNILVILSVISQAVLLSACKTQGEGQGGAGGAAGGSGESSPEPEATPTPEATETPEPEVTVTVTPTPTPTPTPEPTPTQAAGPGYPYYAVAMGSQDIALLEHSHEEQSFEVVHQDTIGTNPQKSLLHPNDRWLLVLYSGKLEVHELGADAKSLTLLDSVTLGIDMQDMEIHEDGRWIVVSDSARSEVYTFSISALRGSVRLQQEHTEWVDGSAHRVEFSGDHKFVYLTQPGTNRMSVYRINEQLGFLSLVQSLPVQLDTPGEIAIQGQSAYVTGIRTGELAVFDIDASGKLREKNRYFAGESSKKPIFHQEDYVSVLNAEGILTFKKVHGRLQIVSFKSIPQGPVAITQGYDESLVYVATSNSIATFKFSVESQSWTNPANQELLNNVSHFTMFPRTSEAL